MAVAAEELVWRRLPTQDELPSDDGIPMETGRHRQQMEVLIRGLSPWAAEQGDVFIAGNQFLHFNAQQLRNKDFRGPDVYVVRGVDPTLERKSWVVWQEGKGPDVIIELLSESTAKQDKTEKFRVYQDVLRVPNYYWFDPFDPSDSAGFELVGGRYRPLPKDLRGGLACPALGLYLRLWEGTYLGLTIQWWRWANPQEQLLLFPEELAVQQAEAEYQRAEVEYQRAEAEYQRAETERQRAETERQRAEAAEAELARLRAEWAPRPRTADG